MSKKFKSKVKPDYKTYLYYLKGGHLMKYNKSTGKKIRADKKVYPKPPKGYMAYAKPGKRGRLTVHHVKMKRRSGVRGGTRKRSRSRGRSRRRKGGRRSRSRRRR